MTLRRAGAALALCLLAQVHAPAHAACDSGLAERMQAKLHPERTLDHGLTACRAWRGIPRGVVVVLPMPRPGTLPGVIDYDLDVLLMQEPTNGNTERAVVLAHWFKRYALRQDHVRIEDIRIDTTHYALAPQLRAFGLRVFYRDDWPARPVASESLSLFAHRGDALEQVLADQEVAYDRGDWQAVCDGRFDTLRSNVGVDAPVHHGLRDIGIDSTVTRSRAVMQDGQCVSVASDPEFSRAVLQFDGERYRPVAGAPDAGNAAPR